jgi:NAD(P)-dependent dehydrogenase (short-subunit alcohol dehydrogenase family)
MPRSPISTSPPSPSPPRPGRLDGRVAVVTGGCGSIGVEVCQQLANEGARVIAADLAAQCSRVPFGPDSTVVTHDLDVTDIGSIARLSETLANAYGRLDVVVNNAGAMLGMPLLQTSLDDAERLYRINVLGPLSVMQALVPLMGGEGAIVNVSSRAGVHARRNLGVYGASKAALVLLTKTAAIELAPIRVNVVTPGPIDTVMPQALLSTLPAEEREQAIEGFSQSVVLQRMGLAREVASTVVFLATDDASYINGAEIPVDGGRF